MELMAACLGRLDQFVNLAVEYQGVEFAVAIFGKTGDGVERVGFYQLAVRRHRSIFITQTPDGPHAEIGIYINASQGRQLLSTINVAAGNNYAGAVIGEFALSREAGVVRILDDGIEELALCSLVLELMKSFAHSPAIVAALDD